MSFPRHDFPRLTPANHRVTSPATVDYNCVAWAAGDTKHWWQPGEFWHPPDCHQEDFGIRALEQAFALLGYAGSSMDADLEQGFEKAALYGSGFVYTHAARQLPTGTWTSKMGKAVDVEHDHPDDVAGGLYGEVVQIMKRRSIENT